MQIFSGDGEPGSITQRLTAAFDIGQDIAAQEPDPSAEHVQQGALAGPVIQRAVEVPQAAVTVVPNK